jgi:hypothetical protein
MKRTWTLPRSDDSLGVDVKTSGNSTPRGTRKTSTTCNVMEYANILSANVFILCQME